MNVAEMFAQAQRLPERMPEFTPASGTGLLVENGAKPSPQAKAIMEAYKPLLERAEIGKTLVGAPAQAKRFEATATLIVAQMLHNAFRTSPQTWAKEATSVAGGDIPSFQRQVIATILRAFPKLFTLQLFPVTPFSGPDGRIYFRTVRYDNAFAGSSPNIAAGDRLDDLTKFNKDFAKVGEGQQARGLGMKMESVTASVSSYRLASDWTYEAEDDLAAIYGTALDSALVGEMSNLLAWTTDRVMIDVATAEVNSTQNWTAQPTGYGALSYSEKKVYDESIYTEGLVPLIGQMNRKRAFNTTPDWMVCGTTFSERLAKLTAFQPIVSQDGTNVSLNNGNLRDIGTIRPLNLRVIVDPQFTADAALLGHRPSNSFDPAIHYAPYKAIRVTGTLENPGTGEYTKGVYTRFAAVKGNGSDPSDQLGDAYGLLTVV